MISRHDASAVGTASSCAGGAPRRVLRRPTFVNSWTGITVAQVRAHRAGSGSRATTRISTSGARRVDGLRLVGLYRRHRPHPPALPAATSPRAPPPMRGSWAARLQNNGRALVVHWDGTNWSAVAGLPLPPVSAPSSSGVVARTAATSGQWARISRRARRVRWSCSWKQSAVGHVAAPGTGHGQGGVQEVGRPGLSAEAISANGWRGKPSFIFAL